LFSRVFSIAKNTFTEAIRQPVFGVILFLAALLLAFSPSFTMFTIGNSIKFLTDMGLATILMAGLLIGAFSASNVISQEIDDKTVLTVISKPVNRFEFIVGKYLGLAASLVVAIFLLSMVLIFAIRTGVRERALEQLHSVVIWAEIGGLVLAVFIAIFANYFFDRPFFSSLIISAVPMAAIVFVTTGFLDRELHPQVFLADLNIQVIWCLVLILLAVLVMSTIAIAASTRLKVVVNVTICVGVFALGLVSDYVFGKIAYGETPSPVAAEESSLEAVEEGARAPGEEVGESGAQGDLTYRIKKAGFRIAYTVVPNIQFLWGGEALSRNRQIQPSYVLKVFFYAMCYQAAILFIAMFLFQEREVS
jgi:ABC-type transport system involved in multi-copper enzyme maturation permease subunit